MVETWLAPLSTGMNRCSYSIPGMHYPGDLSKSPSRVLLTYPCTSTRVITRGQGRARDDLLYAEWEHLSRAEMCAYFWSFINEQYLNELNALPREAWIEIDYTGASVADVFQVANFCGLRGLEHDQIQMMLDKRINSLKDRGAAIGHYPNWKDWNGGQRGRFDRIAYSTMERLGYYNNSGIEWRPQRYGEWWCNHDGGLEWYTWMYNSRARMHREFVQFVRQRDQEGDTIESIADFGCGLGEGYSTEFADKRYIGVDISEKTYAGVGRIEATPSISIFVLILYQNHYLNRWIWFFQAEL